MSVSHTARLTGSVFERLAALVEAGERPAVATVVRTHGSTPQTVGARLIVTDTAGDRPFGTLGGGCVEADAILAAREVLAGGTPSLREYRLNEELDWNTGLVCGGTMWILAESGRDAFTMGGRQLLPELARAAAGEGPGWVFVTRLARVGRGFAFAGRIAVTSDGQAVGTLGDPARDARATAAAIEQLRQGPSRLLADDEGHDLLVEPVTGRPQLIIAGGGHVAKALARQAQLLEFDVTVLEDRPDYANRERFAGATVINAGVADSIATLHYGSQTFLVVATRGHKMDAECVLAAARTNVRYIGLLGSRRKTVLIADMLREHGIPDERLTAIHAPVGLDLGGRSPAEIALSVLAEIMMIRYAATGQPLSRRTAE